MLLERADKLIMQEKSGISKLEMEVEALGKKLPDVSIQQKREGNKQNLFKLVRASTVTKDIFPPEWLIDEVVPGEGLFELFGEPGSLKSFIVQDMCYAIATGIKWHSRDVKQGNVTYIVGEGGNGIRKRFRALELEYRIEDYPLYLSELPMDLMSPKSCEAVATAIKENMGDCSLVVIDTLHRNATGSEDSSEDFSKILQNLDTYFRQVTKAVLWVHHTGHSSKERSRGSSAKFGALDASFKAERGKELKNRVTLLNNKQKDAEEAPNIYLDASVKDLGVVDDKLRPITTLVLKEVNVCKTSENRTMTIETR